MQFQLVGFHWPGDPAISPGCERTNFELTTHHLHPLRAAADPAPLPGSLLELVPAVVESPVPVPAARTAGKILVPVVVVVPVAGDEDVLVVKAFS